MTEIDFDAVLEQLEIASERPAKEIKAEIEGLMAKEGYHLAGAIAVWKSQNASSFVTGKQPYTARVLCFEPTRDAVTSGGATKVANIHFAYENPETAEVEFKEGAIWGEDRIKEYEEIFEEGKVYTFEAGVNSRGQLTRISSLKERDEAGKVLADLGYIMEDDDKAPTVDVIDPLPILNLTDKLGEYELVRGWVGELINKQGTSDPLGFHLSDATSLNPLRVWFAGKYSKMTPAAIQNVKNDLTKTAEMIVYGYVNQKGTDVSLNASAIWFVE